MKLLFRLLAIGVALGAFWVGQQSFASAHPRLVVEEKGQASVQNVAFQNSHSRSTSKVGEIEASAGQREYPVRSLKDTLTSIGAKLAKGISLASNIFRGVKFVASFFKTKYKTETNENYWEELSETASALVEEAIDQVILSQTQDAVKRMSENLELYLDNNSTEGDFSILDLNIYMDNERETIMALYAGINHAENIVLQYVDMVTTRLMLWQATVFRYITEYTIEGKAPSGDTVCAIVNKWNMTYWTEIDEVKTFLLPALKKWNNEYKSKLSVPCETKYVNPAFKQWRMEMECKIFDGYHGVFNRTWTDTCYHKSSPKCPNKNSKDVCNAFCGASKLSHFKEENDKTYKLIKDYVNIMLDDFSIMKSTQIDIYMKQCGY